MKTNANDAISVLKDYALPLIWENRNFFMNNEGVNLEFYAILNKQINFLSKNIKFSQCKWFSFCFFEATLFSLLLFLSGNRYTFLELINFIRFIYFFLYTISCFFRSESFLRDSTQNLFCHLRGKKSKISSGSSVLPCTTKIRSAPKLKFFFFPPPSLVVFDTILKESIPLLLRFS